MRHVGSSDAAADLKGLVPASVRSRIEDDHHRDVDVEEEEEDVTQATTTTTSHAEEFTPVDLSPRAAAAPPPPPPASDPRRDPFPPLQPLDSSASASASSSSPMLIVGSITSPFAKLGFTDQLGLLAIISLVLVVQSSVNCSYGRYECTGTRAYAVASSVIALLASLGALYLDVKQRLPPGRMHLVVSLGHFAWWTAMVLMLTFFGPFSSVQYANGYFATWAGWLCSAMMLSSRNDTFRDTVGSVAQRVSSKPAGYLVLASAVELAASIPTCVPASQCQSLNAFAVALGSVSLVISLALLVLAQRLSVVVVRQVAVFLSVWWMVGGLLVTFIAPFATMGNGYFAVLGAILASLTLLQTGGGEEEEEDEAEQQPPPRTTEQQLPGEDSAVPIANLV